LSNPSEIAHRLHGVREQIAGAAGRAGRSPSAVRLVAVSKTFPLSAVRAAADAGQIDFGENKVQEAQAKIAGAGALPVRWHFIGHLQSNKARKAAALFDVIHSIDSVDLLLKVDAGAADRGRPIDVLIQVDLGREATKHGAAEGDVPDIIQAAAQCQWAALRSLRDGYVASGVPADRMRELSMGMSHDFEVAIEEGATLVRVGSAIFGGRIYG
jgi:pyridoxal phosphate enzyme (YggS family)